MIFKNLLGRKTRTLLTVFGIAVGVAAVVALGALGEGFIQGYRALSGGSGADLLIVQNDALDIVFSAVDQDLKTTISGFPGVEQVSEMIYTFGATDGAPYFIVYGYDPEGFAIDHFKIVEGESLSQYSLRRGKPLLLGKAAAEDLDLTVGDSFRLYESKYRIVGIYETGAPFEDGAAVVLLADAQIISGKPRQVNAFLLKVRDETDVTALRQRIEQRFPELTATTSSDFAEDQDMLQYIGVFTWVVSLIALLIGGVGVMNTMLMSVQERTREFGVLRAVGWRPRRVVRMVLGEAFFLSVLGGFVGVGMGIGAVRAVESVPVVSSMLPGQVSAKLLLQGIGVAMGLGLMGGALPAVHASRLTPAEAMRYDGGAVSGARHVRIAAIRNIMRQPARTLLTVTAIGIAMMSIVLLGALGEGVVDLMTGLATGSDAHLVGLEADASIDLTKIDEGVVRRIATLPGIRGAEGFLMGYTSLGDLPFFVVFGYQPSSPMLDSFEIVAGEPLVSNRQLLLGRVAAENLGYEVGQSMRIFETSFKIVGIYETGVPMQDGAGVVSLRDAQKLFGQVHKVSFIGVWLENPRQADQMIQQIESRFPVVSVSVASEFSEGLVDLEMMQASTWGISFMALLVGGLGMTNTMVMSVYERTREIGVLRALGWQRRRVLGMIIRESITLSLMGGIAGVALGVVLGYTLNLAPGLQGWVKLRFRAGLFAQAIVTAVVLGVVGGVYPAWRASNLLPVEALRYE